MTGSYIDLTQSGATGIQGPAGVAGATGPQGPSNLIQGDTVAVKNTAGTGFGSIINNGTGINFLADSTVGGLIIGQATATTTGVGKNITIRPQYGTPTATSGDLVIDLGNHVAGSTAKLQLVSNGTNLGFIQDIGYLILQPNTTITINSPAGNCNLSAGGVVSVSALSYVDIEAGGDIYLSSQIGAAGTPAIHYRGNLDNTTMDFSFPHNAANAMNWAAGVSGMAFKHNNVNKMSWTATGLAFNTATPVAKPIVSGTKIDPVAASILSALVALGLVTDQTT